MIDLSLVPTEVVHVVIGGHRPYGIRGAAGGNVTSARALPLPTVLVMEEAHTFVKRYKEDIGESGTRASVCCQVFERNCARRAEVRVLVSLLSSQRPSELSPTVLSQCNTFLIAPHQQRS